jgi:hypothetical protein
MSHVVCHRHNTNSIIIMVLVLSKKNLMIAGKKKLLLLALFTTALKTRITHGFSTAALQLGRNILRNKPHQSIRFSSEHDNVDKLNANTSPIERIITRIKSDPSKSTYFSLLMTFSGAALGPLLDSYHSLFGVLTYNTPLVFPILGSIGDGPDLLTCVTSLWVPPLFGMAGFIIGWLYILLDSVTADAPTRQLYPSVSKVLVGISFFTFQYWFSGFLFAHGVDRSLILAIMGVLAAGGFCLLDGTMSGLITSTATAFCGPLIEVGLISSLPDSWAYRYNDAGETGFFPLWIVPVYFLGGPANGNLARCFWNALGSDDMLLEKYRVPCPDCNGTRAVTCPNCDDGTYVTYGERVVCKACRGKGRVICRKCFREYGGDPADIKNIRRIMDRIPD